MDFGEPKFERIHNGPHLLYEVRGSGVRTIQQRQLEQARMIARHCQTAARRSELPKLYKEASKNLPRGATSATVLYVPWLCSSQS